MSQKDPILQSWEDNAAAWVHVVDADAIASRKLATNAAIINTILAFHPRSVLDIGCGEGWLCRKLAEEGLNVTGIDGVADLIKQAQQRKGGISYMHADYQHLVHSNLLEGQTFDLIVCNFSLFDQKDTAALLSYLPTFLSPPGHLLIHTLHPDQQPADIRHQSGWREERWAGLDKEFSGGYHWYYRSMEDWQKLFASHQLHAAPIKEIPHPETGQGLSVIFCLQGPDLAKQ